MRLKAMAALFASAAVVVGCKSDGPTDPGPPAGFSVVGTWLIVVDAAANCWPAFETRISIPQASLTAGANGIASVLNSQGWWYVAGTGPDVTSTLSGTVDLNRGTVSLRLWQGASAAKQGHFEGSAQSATRISGTFTDPDGLFRTTASTHPCSASAHADKD
ncbi:MAG: hypothetical protein ACJ8GN_05950 [Longimicrobiaceae bacterium]